MENLPDIDVNWNAVDEEDRKLHKAFWGAYRSYDIGLYEVFFRVQALQRPKSVMLMAYSALARFCRKGKNRHATHIIRAFNQIRLERFDEAEVLELVHVVNCVAKEKQVFYDFKAFLCWALVALGGTAEYTEDEEGNDVIVLKTSDGGRTRRFHDPYGATANLLRRCERGATGTPLPGASGVST